MWEWISETFYSEPEKMMSRGRLLLSLAFGMAVAGGVNLFVGVMTRVAQRHLPTPGPETLVAQFGEPWWSFWVPETPLGFAVILGLALLGAAQFWFGRDLHRQSQGRRYRGR